MERRGHLSGHAGGYDWAAYLDALVEEHGSLVGVAERLAESRGFVDELASIERALRRLRSKGTGEGGQWGTRLVRRFGMPGAVERRLRWMAAYHSRFTDLPVPVCEDMVRAWDRPPVTASAGCRAWIALADATIALRRQDMAAGEAALVRARVDEKGAGPEARIERLLTDAFVASKQEEGWTAVAGLLEEVGGLLADVEDADERACLHARWIDQRAYELNRGRRGAPDRAAAEALYREIPAVGPPFALARRANGLAYAAWKQGRAEEGAAWARAAARHAGDGGHVRLRTMALAMLARISPGEAEAKQRGAEMAARLDDETLRLRLARR